MPTYLEETRDRVAAALEPLGVRVAMDPATIVPPCLVLDLTPKPIRDTTCGEVLEYAALLLPAASTSWLAALWLAQHRKAIRDAIDAAGCQVIEEAGVEYGSGDDLPATPAYLITFHA